MLTCCRRNRDLHPPRIPPSVGTVDRLSRPPPPDRPLPQWDTLPQSIEEEEPDTERPKTTAPDATVTPESPHEGDQQEDDGQYIPMDLGSGSRKYNPLYVNTSPGGGITKRQNPSSSIGRTGNPLTPQPEVSSDNPELNVNGNNSEGGGCDNLGFISDDDVQGKSSPVKRDPPPPPAEGHVISPHRYINVPPGGVAQVAVHAGNKETDPDPLEDQNNTRETQDNKNEDPDLVAGSKEQEETDNESNVDYENTRDWTRAPSSIGVAPRERTGNSLNSEPEVSRETGSEKEAGEENHPDYVNTREWLDEGIKGRRSSVTVATPEEDESQDHEYVNQKQWTGSEGPVDPNIIATDENTSSVTPRPPLPAPTPHVKPRRSSNVDQLDQDKYPNMTVSRDPNGSRKKFEGERNSQPLAAVHRPTRRLMPPIPAQRPSLMKKPSAPVGNHGNRARVVEEDVKLKNLPDPEVASAGSGPHAPTRKTESSFIKGLRNRAVKELHIGQNSGANQDLPTVVSEAGEDKNDQRYKEAPRENPTAGFMATRYEVPNTDASDDEGLVYEDTELASEQDGIKQRSNPSDVNNNVGPPISPKKHNNASPGKITSVVEEVYEDTVIESGVKPVFKSEEKSAPWTEPSRLVTVSANLTDLEKFENSSECLYEPVGEATDGQLKPKPVREPKAAKRGKKATDIQPKATGVPYQEILATNREPLLPVSAKPVPTPRKGQERPPQPLPKTPKVVFSSIPALPTQVHSPTETSNKKAPTGVGTVQKKTHVIHAELNDVLAKWRLKADQGAID